MFYLIALLSGVLFGAGMLLSGMVDPANVLGFLNITGDWNPSLMLVMGGAIMVMAPVYWLLVVKRERSLLGQSWQLPLKQQIDKRLISGAVIFGLGWGIAGICPGPALSSLLTAGTPMLVFVIAMAAGIGCTQVFNKLRASR